MVKRVQCRVVESASLGSGSFCAGLGPAEVSGPAAGDPICPEPVERDIAKILDLIYKIKCSWLRKQLSNRKARPGLVVDFLA